jgi:hypothetical protein
MILNTKLSALARVRRERRLDRSATLVMRIDGDQGLGPKAPADRLEDARIKGDELKITPLKAATPEEGEAETLADRLYGMTPNLRITSLLAEAARARCCPEAHRETRCAVP